MACYSDLYKDLILYDNQDIKAMNDWFAGRYATVNDVDVPAVNAVWNRLDGELTDAEVACS
jgi:hydrogenase maturation factor HypE